MYVFCASWRKKYFWKIWVENIKTLKMKIWSRSANFFSRLKSHLKICFRSRRFFFDWKISLEIFENSEILKILKFWDFWNICYFWKNNMLRFLNILKFLKMLGFYIFENVEIFWLKNKQTKNWRREVPYNEICTRNVPSSSKHICILYVWYQDSLYLFLCTLIINKLWFKCIWHRFF